jgi:hypothetical protein
MSFASWLQPLGMEQTPSDRIPITAVPLMCLSCEVIGRSKFVRC